MTAPDKIAALITRFDNNLEAYRSNPLFISPNTHPAYQLRRYAWSAKLPLSILTDFEELAIYDCRQRPTPKDKASTARTHYIKYNEYPDHWDEIASIFSKDAVLKGSFDKYAESGKRHKPEVDSEFLKEIESWRETLAKNIALRKNSFTGLCWSLKL